MSISKKIKALLNQFFPLNRPTLKLREMATAKESGTYQGEGVYSSREFERDYNAASSLLKQKMNAKYPDNFHAKLGSSVDNAYDYGVDRAGAVDMISTVIAAALRRGATVQQAADAGAASVGI